ncbi:MAG: DUF1540 domain-containing protein [Oscillospiraceae bacterium]|nr:DUF1540 domain-containing protein [Oscillospiraceae bacterium]
MEHHEPVLNGICCDALNCVHNNGSSCCTAGTIHIKNFSSDPGTTFCGTFAEI